MPLIPWTDRCLSRLKKIKKDRKDLADYLEVHIATVNGYFRTVQQNEPSLETLDRIAKFLGVHPAWLVYGVRVKEPKNMVDEFLRQCVDLVVDCAEEMDIDLETAQAVKIAIHIYQNYDNLSLTNETVASLINLSSN